jgi:uncharacterized protein (UPF0548 family)
VISLTRPSEARIRRALDSYAALGWSYPEVGATLSGVPHGYPINHHRTQLGRGEAVFRRGVAALHDWQMYALPWTTVHGSPTSPEAGAVVGVLVRHFGFWSLNPSRIVYVLREQGSDGDEIRSGFALGTLPGHSESGEERFTVEWDPRSDGVAFEIFTFARPQHWLARLAPPLVTAVQNRFGREACAAMRRATGAREV